MTIRRAYVILPYTATEAEAKKEKTEMANTKRRPARLPRRRKEAQPITAERPIDPRRLDSNGEDWVLNMPEENEYVLQIDEWATGMNEPLQSISLTREEYIGLKQALARMRGLTAEEVSHAA